MIKVLERIRLKGSYLNIIKVVYGKLTANAMINRERVKATSRKSGTKQGFQLSTQFSYLVLFSEFLRAIREEKYGSHKSESFFVNMMLVIRETEYFTRKLL